MPVMPTGAAMDDEALDVAEPLPSPSAPSSPSSATQSPAATPPASPELSRRTGDIPPSATASSQQPASAAAEPAVAAKPPPAAAADEEEPEHLTCPISRCLFRDPVFVPGSGNT